MKARDAVVLSVLRETLAAIDNAEAPQPVSFAPSTGDGPFAGSASGSGLTPSEGLSVIKGETDARREAQASYVEVGRHAEAEVVSVHAALLERLITEQSA